MKAHNYSDLEQLFERRDPTMRRVIADVDRACSAPMPAHLREDIGRRLRSAAAEPPRRRAVPDLRIPHRPWARSKLAYLAVAAVVVLSVGLGYLRLERPTAVSAAQILRRSAVAMANVAPGDVVHEITHVHLIVDEPAAPPSNDDLTVEQWTQVDANGHPMQVDLRMSSPNRSLDERTIADAQGTMWIYGAKPDVVTKSTWTPGKSLFGGLSPSDPVALLFLAKDTMYKPQDPSYIHDLLKAAASGRDGALQYLGQQTLADHTVNVVQIAHPLAAVVTSQPPHWAREIFTIYVDASTSLIRRIDYRGVNDRDTTVFDQSFDVTTYDVVSISQVPPGTFTFTPTPGTKVCIPSRTTAPGTIRCTIVRGNA